MITPPTLTYTDPEGAEGGTLQVISDGTWLNGPMTFEYKWRRQPTANLPGNLWFGNPGNTPIIYNAQSQGSPPEVLCEVVATNLYGSTSAYTNSKVIDGQSILWVEVPMKFKDSTDYANGDPFEVFYRGKQLGRANDASPSEYRTSSRGQLSLDGKYVIGSFLTNNIFNNNDYFTIIAYLPSGDDGNVKQGIINSQRFRHFRGADVLTFPTITGSLFVGSEAVLSYLGSYKVKTPSGNVTGDPSSIPVETSTISWYVNGVRRVDEAAFVQGVTDRYTIQPWDRGAYIYASLRLTNTPATSYPYYSQRTDSIERVIPLA